ncbi:hypothetical protein F0562_034065 [Nyssa sinensis]|uniref:F-box domain-containing protein n=1 Tax=Nyssa sinensis TaxID=561372 RepID=A0A5J5AHB3_9ASTE|nr:hypothetical protein F0562_034065 [Nyssa sinensis]
MEVIRTSAAVMVLLGWFWEDIVNIFKNTNREGKEEEKKKENNTCSNSMKKHDVTDLPDAAKTSSCSKEELSEDVMMQILCRLPPQTLSRFKCVSSTWRRLIIQVFDYHRCTCSSSGFIFSLKGFVRDMHAPESGLWCCYDYSSSHDHQHQNQNLLGSLPAATPSSAHDNRELLDCCNGLLLFRNSCPYTTARYMVCNPTTGESVEIPGKTTFHDTDSVNHALAFDPSESIHYKIVLILKGSFRRECIGLHNGSLHYALFNGEELLIFTLEEEGAGFWSLKHNISNIYGDFITHNASIFREATTLHWFRSAEVYAFHPDSDIILIGYKDHIDETPRRAVPRFIIYWYNYKLQRIERHLRVDYKIKEGDSVLAFSFSRCFFSLPGTGTATACTEVPNEKVYEQNFGSILSSNSMIVARDSKLDKPAVVCKLRFRPASLFIGHDYMRPNLD